MPDLEKDYNLEADLAQSAYTGRKNNFPYEELKPSQKEKLDNNQSVKFDFPGAQDASGNKVDTVYLQPDNTVETVTEKNVFGRENSYDKGLLTDEEAGYNSYYLTDTPTLNKDTKHTYFALGDAHIPQAKLVTEAMHQKIKEISDKAPNATISMTGQSLGRMVTIQAVANLLAGDISKLDKVILFQGPDARESINKMSKQASVLILLILAKIKTLLDF